MKENRKKYNLFKFSSAIFMMMALLWLTVSIPFVYASQQKTAEHSKQANAGNEEESNPFSNTTEEKTPSNASVSEEYLHDHPSSDCFFLTISQAYNCEDDGTYIAFHGELLVPPPNAA
jgi:hypothetical protein